MAREITLALGMVVALLAVPAYAASGEVRCVRASGAAATRCLADYTRAVAQCRNANDAACETTARAIDGPLAGILAAPEPSVRRACAEDDAVALGYQTADDVVVRARNACGDFGEELLAAAYPDAGGSVAGAFLACRRLAGKQLERLRVVIVERFGPGCAVRATQGRRCSRARRDRAVAHARAAVARVLQRRCRTRLAALGLDPLAPVLDRVVTSARHFAQQAYPPNDLGPTAELGAFPVGIRTLALSDPARLDTTGQGPRPVTVEVYYPSTAAAVAGVPKDVATVLGQGVAVTPAYRDVPLASGTYPLVVFSHGNQGIRIQSFFFAAHLASHGFIVVSPDHHGNTFVDSLAGVIDPQAAANRPRDLSFVIDQFLAMNATAGNMFAGAIDPDRIGASGHSFGGFTVFLLAGGASPVGTFTDARIKAILPQAPAAPFPDEFFATITVPTLVIGGSIDETTEFVAQQQRPFDLLPAGAAVVALARLMDAGHFTFSDFCEVDRRLLEFLGGFDEACEPRHLPWRHAHDIVNYLALNFFDAVLNGNAEALARLAPAAVGGIDDLAVQRK